jgi:hypothetical protein
LVKRTGQRVAAEQADERRGDPQQQALRYDHLNDCPPARAVHAQVRDRLASIGHGQQQRVEREQEPQERADRREQVARLVARSQRLVQQAEIAIGRRHIQTAARQPPQSPADFRFVSAVDLHEHARDPIGEACQLLQPGQRHHRHGGARERTERFRPEHGRHVQPVRYAAQHHRHLLLLAARPVADAERLGGRATETDAAGGERRDRERARQAVERGEPDRRAGDRDGRATAVAGCHGRRLFQQRRGALDAVQFLDSFEELPRHAVGAEPAMLPLATSVANTSATATATPRPASSSCAVCTRRRLR